MSNDRTQQHLQLVRSICEWVEKIGLQDEQFASSVAVDLADLLYAASEVRGLLERLLATDLNAGTGLDEALQLAASIEVELFHELKPHLEDLERNWERVLEQLDRDT